MIRREAHTMHQQLSTVERTQIPRRRVAQTDDAHERVAGRVSDRDGVRELLGRVDAIAMADRHIGVGARARGLSRPGRLDDRKGCGGQRYAEEEDAFHFGTPRVCDGGSG